VIPLTTIVSYPYNLLQGDSVVAKVVAINSIGESAESPEGNGAVIVQEPDAPTSVTNDASITNES